MIQKTIGPTYHSYLHRLSGIWELDATAAEFGEDLTRDSENGALTPGEQSSLVTLFAEKLTDMYMYVTDETPTPNTKASTPASSSTTPCSFALTLP